MSNPSPTTPIVDPSSSSTTLIPSSSTPNSTTAPSTPIVLPPSVTTTPSTPTPTTPSIPVSPNIPTPIIPPTIPSSLKSTSTPPATIPFVFPSFSSPPSYSSSSSILMSTASSSIPTITYSSTTTAPPISYTPSVVEYTITSHGEIVVLTVITSLQISSATSIDSSATKALTNNDNSNSNYSTFFANTGAVAGVFTIVALIIAGFLAGVVYYFVKRRRAKRLDEDVRVAVGGAGDGGAGVNRFANEEDDDDVQEGAIDPFHTSQGSHDGHSYYQHQQQPQMSSYNTMPVSRTFSQSRSQGHNRTYSNTSPILQQVPNDFGVYTSRPRSQDRPRSGGEMEFTDWPQYLAPSASERMGDMRANNVGQEDGEHHTSVEGFTENLEHNVNRESVRSQWSQLEPIAPHQHLVDEQDYSRRILSLRVANPEKGL